MPSGLNQGIKAPTDPGDICEELVNDSVGNTSITKKYRTCVRDEAYDTEASTCDKTEYNQDGLEYYEFGDSGRYYTHCQCDPAKYDMNNPQSSNDEDVIKDLCGDAASAKSEKDIGAPQFCRNTGSSDDKYYPHRNLCCSQKMDEGYELLYQGSFYSIDALEKIYSESAIKANIKAKCRHEANASIKFNCTGAAYYKCIDRSVAASGTWYTKDDCKALDQNQTSLLEVGGFAKPLENSWLSSQSVTLYSKCSCPLNYSKDVSCTARGGEPSVSAALERGIDAPICFNKGHTSGYKDQGNAVTPNSVSCSLHTNNEVCIDYNGSRKYDWRKCTCDGSVYPIKESGGSLNHRCCGSGGGHTCNLSDRSCHYAYCIDARGVYRSSDNHLRNDGGTSTQWSDKTCSVTNGYITCR